MFLAKQTPHGLHAELLKAIPPQRCAPRRFQTKQDGPRLQTSHLLLGQTGLRKRGRTTSERTLELSAHVLKGPSLQRIEFRCEVSLKGTSPDILITPHSPLKETEVQRREEGGSSPRN